MNDDVKEIETAAVQDISAEAPLTAKEEAAEIFRTIVIALVLAILVRSFLWEPFNIPSGSMKPTLLVGDYLFVNKYSYGYSRYSFPFGIVPIEGRAMAKDPQRGDIIVFKLPIDTRIDYIKRIIGLPGDRVQVRGGRLYINDQQVEREFVARRSVTNDDGEAQSLQEYQETLPGGVVHTIYEASDYESLDDTPEYTVPEGHYFAMGDNRDHSADSRKMDRVGFIPFENIVGKARILFFSSNGKAALFEVWKWPWGVRYDRIFKSLTPDHDKAVVQD